MKKVLFFILFFTSITSISFIKESKKSTTSEVNDRARGVVEVLDNVLKKVPLEKSSAFVSQEEVLELKSIDSNEKAKLSNQKNKNDNAVVDPFAKYENLDLFNISADKIEKIDELSQVIIKEWDDELEKIFNSKFGKNSEQWEEFNSMLEDYLEEENFIINQYAGGELGQEVLSADQETQMYEKLKSEYYRDFEEYLGVETFRNILDARNKFNNFLQSKINPEIFDSLKIKL